MIKLRLIWFNYLAAYWWCSFIRSFIIFQCLYSASNRKWRNTEFLKTFWPAPISINREKCRITQQSNIQLMLLLQPHLLSLNHKRQAKGSGRLNYLLWYLKKKKSINQYCTSLIPIHYYAFQNILNIKEISYLILKENLISVSTSCLKRSSFPKVKRTSKFFCHSFSLFAFSCVSISSSRCLFLKKTK